jgi:uracil phosphoribosyltransferase
MRVHVADHPLIAQKVTVLRDERTPSPLFRQLTAELVSLLTYEATRGIRTEKISVTTPVGPAEGVALSHPRPLIVPILRAGLGMLQGITDLLPTAEVGFLGIKRDEETLQPYTYANRLPEDLNGRQVYIIDPMLATGGTLIDSIDYVFERGATEVTAICLIGAPEGVEALRLRVKNRDVSLVLGALDSHLNQVGYIVPGLGDAGDRLYGLSVN